MCWHFACLRMSSLCWSIFNVFNAQGGVPYFPEGVYQDIMVWLYDMISAYHVFQCLVAIEFHNTHLRGRGVPIISDRTEVLSWSAFFSVFCSDDRFCKIIPKESEHHQNIYFYIKLTKIGIFWWFIRHSAPSLSVCLQRSAVLVECLSVLFEQ